MSINPKEGPALAAQKKQAYIERYGRPQTAAAGTSSPDARKTSERSPTRSASATPTTKRSSSTRTAPAIELLTPKGVIARYFYGIEYRAARHASRCSSRRRRSAIGSPIDNVLLLCYHYDPATGKYGAAVDEARADRRGR